MKTRIVNGSTPSSYGSTSRSPSASNCLGTWSTMCPYGIDSNSVVTSMVPNVAYMTRRAPSRSDR